MTVARLRNRLFEVLCHCVCPLCMYTRTRIRVHSAYCVWKCTVIFSWILNTGPHSCIWGGGGSNSLAPALHWAFYVYSVSKFEVPPPVIPVRVRRVCELLQTEMIWRWTKCSSFWWRLLPRSQSPSWFDVSRRDRWSRNERIIRDHNMGMWKMTIFPGNESGNVAHSSN